MPDDSSIKTKEMLKKYHKEQQELVDVIEDIINIKDDILLRRILKKQGVYRFRF